MSWTLDNNSINQLAPLTQLDIHTYVAKFDNDLYKVITPHFTPETWNSITPGAGVVLSREFDEMLTTSIDEWMKSDRSFKEAFDRACIKGNVFLDPEGEKMLAAGFESLSNRKLLGSSDIERYARLWYRYAKKCPKCSSELEAGAKYCNSCGSEL
ncbi:MAG: zinc-ribbon domain-containing protein, partial [Candidatus Thorarchaeota archaeon]